MASYCPYTNIEAKAYPADAVDGRPDRSARDVLGAGQVGREAASAHDKRAA